MSYRIERVLNNNAVVSLDDKNEEFIITGPGIAYGKKYGGYVNKNKVDKIYKLEKDEDTNKLITLFKSIPNDFIEIVDRAINIAKKEYQLELNDSLYLVLPDHINSAIERYKKGIIFENKLLWEIKNIYRQEFELAKKIVLLIKEITDIEFKEDEAAFIALHIVNSESTNNMFDINIMTKRTKDIIKIIDLHFSKQVNKDSLEYNRLLTHIKYFVDRVLRKEEIKVNGEDNIFKNMKQLYPYSVKCLDKISNYLKNNEDYELKEIEKLYLLIHIARLYEM